MKNLFQKQNLTHKGRKTYAITKTTNFGTLSPIICGNDDIKRVISSMDSKWNVLVELTVTRVFTRERDLKEIEIEQINGN